MKKYAPVMTNTLHKNLKTPATINSAPKLRLNALLKDAGRPSLCSSNSCYQFSSNTAYEDSTVYLSGSGKSVSTISPLLAYPTRPLIQLKVSR